MQEERDNKENEVKNEVENRSKDGNEDTQDGAKSEPRRKSSSRDSKLAPGDHTLARRLDGTWCEYFLQEESHAL